MKKKLIDVLIVTTDKARCGAKDFTIWLDFSKPDKAVNRELWGKIREMLGIDMETTPNASDIWELLGIMQKLGYVRYFEC